MARPHSVVSVTLEDRGELRARLRRSTTRQSVAQRARMLLLSDEGLTVEEVAERLDCSALTVYKWRRRYCQDGLDGLGDRPRPGRPTKLTQ